MYVKIGAVLQLFLFSFIIVFLVSCCGKHVPKIPHTSQRNVFPYEAFVYIKITALDNEPLKKAMHPDDYSNLKRSKEGSGSGIVIKAKNNTEILTAAHVCENPNSPVGGMFFESEIYAYSWYGKGWAAQIVAIDHDRDLCLLEIKGITFPESVDIAKSDPEIGDVGFLAASPLGVFVERMPLLFDGYYAGVDPNQAQMWTIPVAPGCSGGGIVNADKELVGIITAGIVDFQNVSLAVSRQGILEFLSEWGK